MATLPDQLSETFTVQRIAQVLTCHNDPDCSDPAMVHGDHWVDIIHQAIPEELQPVGEESDRKKVKGLWVDERRLHRADVLQWLRKKGVVDGDIPPELWPAGGVPSPQPRGAPSKAEEEGQPSKLLAIAALLELLTSDEKLRYNQSNIATTIEEKNKNVHGLSKSNLEKLFAAANKLLSEERKKR